MRRSERTSYRRVKVLWHGALSGIGTRASHELVNCPMSFVLRSDIKDSGFTYFILYAEVHTRIVVVPLGSSCILRFQSIIVIKAST
jgi:hypothetical protein